MFLSLIICACRVSGHALMGVGLMGVVVTYRIAQNVFLLFSRMYLFRRGSVSEFFLVILYVLVMMILLG
jgi:hypothetical protein